MSKGVAIGDKRKSWDVLKTARFLETNVSKASAVLDVGAYASEILYILYKLGFADLTGIDLNPNLGRMPQLGDIKYVSGDFTKTDFPSQRFGAVTAISVLEHGFCGAKVFSEVSRLLQPRGYFVGSIDYWPDKIDTSGIDFFGVDWKIFSKNELLGLISEARQFGLVPVGQLEFDASERTVRCSGRRYTFAWFAFQKLETS
jgi:SAM-dependent methyltransferase